MSWPAKIAGDATMPSPDMPFEQGAIVPVEPGRHVVPIRLVADVDPVAAGAAARRLRDRQAGQVEKVGALLRLIGQDMRTDNDRRALQHVELCDRAGAGDPRDAHRDAGDAGDDRAVMRDGDHEMVDVVDHLGIDTIVRRPQRDLTPERQAVVAQLHERPVPRVAGEAYRCRDGIVNVDVDGFAQGF